MNHPGSRFPLFVRNGLRVNVHRGSDIGMAQQFLLDGWLRAERME